MTSRFDENDPVIAQGEAWLRERMDDRLSLDRERIKRRIHLELNERWLDRKMAEVDMEPFSPKLQAAIRRELNKRTRSRDMTSALQRSAQLRWRTFWGTGLSAAAACLVLMIGRAPMDFRPLAFSAIDAFAAYESDGAILELAALRSRVAEPASGGNSESNDEVSRGLTNLRESIDRILGASEDADDWS